MGDDDVTANNAASNDWGQTNNDNMGAQPPAQDNLPTDMAPTDGGMAAPSASPTDDTSGATNALLDLKSKALDQLTPIFSHLDQSPEDKFKTTMMMIQASDNQDLIKEAYEAALQISDERIKAQALLDVVNEINYFTRPS